jgi:uncharacterized protein (UPF0333 family)
MILVLMIFSAIVVYLKAGRITRSQAAAFEVRSQAKAIAAGDLTGEEVATCVVWSFCVSAPRTGIQFELAYDILQV